MAHKTITSSSLFVSVENGPVFLDLNPPKLETIIVSRSHLRTRDDMEILQHFTFAAGPTLRP